MPLGEFGLIDWIREKQGQPSPFVTLGIGDDCALLRFGGQPDVMVTTDMLMDGRHFRLEEATPEQVGRKAMGVNLSDIAAMAGRPVAAFVAVALPKGQGRAVEVAQGLHKGISELAGRFGVTLAGGDTNAWDGPLVICVTVIGVPLHGPAVRRSGAKPGDRIFVTGPLGGSILGRHLDPNPRFDAAWAIQQRVPIHAMIDVSDGLASDLGHILEESGNLGATLDRRRIPIHADVHRLPEGDPLRHALTDGEDFELCLTLDPSDADQLLKEWPADLPLHEVGRIECEPGLRLRDEDGCLQTFDGKGFDHLARRSES